MTRTRVLRNNFTTKVDDLTDKVKNLIVWRTPKLPLKPHFEEKKLEEATIARPSDQIK